MKEKISSQFFQRDILNVAPDLLGKFIVRRFDNGETLRLRITDIEIYRGEEDKACHASKGRTKRSETLYCEGGVIYVYLIYGMYWLLNFVTGEVDHPQAILIRGVEGTYGPGRIGRLLRLDASFNREPIMGNRLWIENSDETPLFKKAPRIGIDYAQEWKDVEWRYYIDE